MRTLLYSAALLFTAGGAAAQAPKLACVPQRPVATLATRASTYDSLRITASGKTAQLCYGRPSARNRKIFGGELVPFGKLWRTGADEPTTLHLPFAAMIAGVHVEPGSYSIYTVPGATDWEIIINKSITQWGHESRYTDQVKAQEVGRGKVKSEKLPSHVEKLTFRTAPASGGTDLLLEWETTRVRIPIRPM